HFDSNADLSGTLPSAFRNNGSNECSYDDTKVTCKKPCACSKTTPTSTNGSHNPTNTGQATGTPTTEPPPSNPTPGNSTAIAAGVIVPIVVLVVAGLFIYHQRALQNRWRFKQGGPLVPVRAPLSAAPSIQREGPPVLAPISAGAPIVGAAIARPKQQYSEQEVIDKHATFMETVEDLVLSMMDTALANVSPTDHGVFFKELVLRPNGVRTSGKISVPRNVDATALDHFAVKHVILRSVYENVITFSGDRRVMQDQRWIHSIVRRLLNRLEQCGVGDRVIDASKSVGGPRLPAKSIPSGWTDAFVGKTTILFKEAIEAVNAIKSFNAEYEFLFPSTTRPWTNGGHQSGLPAPVGFLHAMRLGSRMLMVPFEPGRKQEFIDTAGEEKGIEVAVKSFRGSEDSKVSHQTKLYYLLRLSGISHFLNVYAYVQEENTIYVVMEWMDRKSLANLITDLGSGDVEFSFAIMLKIIYGILSIGATLASLGIVHADIKPQNFLLNSAFDVKLADFGAAMKRLRDTGLHVINEIIDQMVCSNATRRMTCQEALEILMEMSFNFEEIDHVLKASSESRSSQQSSVSLRNAGGKAVISSSIGSPAHRQESPSWPNRTQFLQIASPSLRPLTPNAFSPGHVCTVILGTGTANHSVNLMEANPGESVKAMFIIEDGFHLIGINLKTNIEGLLPLSHLGERYKNSADTTAPQQEEQEQQQRPSPSARTMSDDKPLPSPPEFRRQLQPQQSQGPDRVATVPNVIEIPAGFETCSRIVATDPKLIEVPAGGGVHVSSDQDVAFRGSASSSPELDTPAVYEQLYSSIVFARETRLKNEQNGRDRNSNREPNARDSALKNYTA
ncbi:hypothetical protein HK102_003743, partial [Quaeritorhiza haematococci]